MREAVLVPLKALVSPVSTWNPLKLEHDGDSFEYIDLSAVDQESKSITKARVIPCADAPSRARQLVQANDVLVSTVRPSLNGVAMVPTELEGATASTGFCVVRAKRDVLEPSYVFQWVKSPTFVGKMVKFATGASYPAVSDRIILESEIPLPPLAEQRRIAAILDKADALRTKRREVLAQLDRLTQSIFQKLMSECASDLAHLSIEDCTARIIDYRGKTPEKTASGVPLVTAKIVKNGELLQPSEFIAEGDYEAWMRRGLPQEGDVLFTTEAPLGEVAQMDCRKVALAQRLLLLRGKSGVVDNTYLMFALTSPEVRRQIESRATGSTVKGIRQGELRQVVLPIPPIDAQIRFSQRIARYVNIRSSGRSSQLHLEQLFGVLQQRAFQGAL